MRATDDAPAGIPTLQISLFGAVRFRINDHPAPPLPTRKAEALLIYLICRREPHQRETLADLLWNDLPAERAAGNLRLILNQLRKSFAPFLDITRQTIALRQDRACRSDVQELSAALAAESAELETLAAALALYRGDFLQGFHLRDAHGFSEWQADQAEYWRQQALSAMQRLVAGYTAQGSYAEAITWASRILKLDPLDEAAHRQLMLLFARKGQRTGAIRQYQACREILQQELGLDPEPATETLYQRICRTPARRPHTLPPCPRPLLGRAPELARAFAWLAGAASRLLSIVGAGGSGKTDLALTIGWRVIREYCGPCSDGAFYIPLIAHDSSASPVDDTELLALIARNLQLTHAGRHNLLDHLIRQLQGKELLLIIDNGELLDPSARLALGSLLLHTPDLRVLVASRERLRLRDESLLDLRGLDYPTLPSQIVTPRQEQRLAAALAEYPAVQLFLECARHMHTAGDFQSYAPGDQLAIGKICEIVHGLPLAIQLITPWLRVRSPSEIVREIACAIDRMTSDMPDLPERHRSIRAVFDYSWQLISHEERVALAKLAVFPATFTAHAAEAIAAVPVTCLALLRDKSLIQALLRDAETRYTLHPLLRQLAWHKLQCDPSQATAIQAGHAGYFAAFAAQHQEQIRGKAAPSILKRLESEIDNLRAGWEWATAARDVTALGRYSIPLHDLCAIRGWELEGRQLFRAAASAIQQWHADQHTPEADLLAAARVLLCYAELEYILGALDTAEAALQQSRALLSFQAIEDAPELMCIYKQLGLIAYWRGAYGEALDYLHLTLQIAEECADADKCADALLAICGVAYAQGNWSYAETAVRRCLTIYQDQNDPWGVGHSLRFRGMIAVSQADYQAARHFLDESLAVVQQIGNRIGEALAWDRIGLLELAQGRLPQSTAALQRGLEIFQELGVDVEYGRALCHLGRAVLAQGNLQAAQQHVGEALRIAQRVQLMPLLIESLAVAIQLWSSLQRAAEDPAIITLLRSLWQHPACPADNKAYIQSLLPEHYLAQALAATKPDQWWSLEQLRAEVSAWVADRYQPSPTGMPSKAIMEGVA